MLKVQRNRAALKTTSEEDDNYVDASPAERFEMVWMLTSELWSLKEPGNVEQRLQRDVAHLSRK